MPLQSREFLMIPGPTPVPDAILEAIARHPIGHRSSEFSTIFQEVTKGLRWLAETDNDVFLLTASGTAAMEAAIANTISPNDHVLSLVCGVFSERWAKIAEAYGARVERLVVEPGNPILPSQLQSKLEGIVNYKAITMTHNETSTGVLNDVEALVKLAREHEALSIVDAVTSFGATPLPIDRWNIDIVVAGSQKALMLPPGLSVIFFSQRAWQAYAISKSPRFYFDLGHYKKSLDENATPFTPNVCLTRGLHESLKIMQKEGKEAIYLRHQQLKLALRKGVKALGLDLFVDSDCASPTITSILPPSQWPVDTIRHELKERFRIVIADGQEKLQGKIFRIGHMGFVFERDILMTLAALSSILIKLGYKCNTNDVIGSAAAAFVDSNSG